MNVKLSKKGQLNVDKKEGGHPSEFTLVPPSNQSQTSCKISIGKNLCFTISLMICELVVQPQSYVNLIFYGS